MKRYSNMAKLMVKDVSFLKDGSMEVLVRRSKTDQLGRGAKLYLYGEKVGGGLHTRHCKMVPEGARIEGEGLFVPQDAS